MNQWVETREGKSYWYQQYDAKELDLLTKYKTAFTRLTKLDIGCILKGEEEK